MEVEFRKGEREPVSWMNIWNVIEIRAQDDKSLK